MELEIVGHSNTIGNSYDKVNNETISDSDGSYSCSNYNYNGKDKTMHLNLQSRNCDHDSSDHDSSDHELTLCTQSRDTWLAVDDHRHKRKNIYVYPIVGRDGCCKMNNYNYNYNGTMYTSIGNIDMCTNLDHESSLSMLWTLSTETLLRQPYIEDASSTVPTILNAYEYANHAAIAPTNNSLRTMLTLSSELLQQPYIEDTSSTIPSIFNQYINHAVVNIMDSNVLIGVTIVSPDYEIRTRPIWIISKL